MYSEKAMAQKSITDSLLLEIYGEVLSDKQRDALRLYFDEDLGYSEIAENTGVSRQAAMDAIQKGRKRLQELESALGLLSKYTATNQAVTEMLGLIKGNGLEEELKEKLKEKLTAIRAAWGDR